MKSFEYLRREAPCLDAENADTFSPVGPSDPCIEVAKKICAGCGLQSECFSDALQSKDVEGIRGGTEGVEREAILRARKHPQGTPAVIGTVATVVFDREDIYKPTPVMV